jgi:hypothetical protein
VASSAEDLAILQRRLAAETVRYPMVVIDISRVKLARAFLTGAIGPLECG